MSIHNVHWCIFLHLLNMLQDWVSVSWLHKRCDPLTSVSWAQNTAHTSITLEPSTTYQLFRARKAKAALQLSRLPNEPWLLVETMNGLEKTQGRSLKHRSLVARERLTETERHSASSSHKLIGLKKHFKTFSVFWFVFFWFFFPFNYHCMKIADSCMSQDNGIWYCIILFAYSKILR